MAKILIVEDDDAFRVTLERMTRSAGHDPNPVSGRRQVTDAIAAAAYDVVLTDILMPDFDGLEVIRMVRGQAAVPDHRGVGRGRSPASADGAPARQRLRRRRGAQ
jgi:CheY-like chemotaxis protein